MNLPAGDASHDERPARDGGGLQEITTAQFRGFYISPRYQYIMRLYR
jgi:hypothetical protein